MREYSEQEVEEVKRGQCVSWEIPAFAVFDSIFEARESVLPACHSGRSAGAIIADDLIE
jgi:hypothetical protein